jgi:hypothetical protein
MKPDPTRTVCIKDDASEENDKQRKGNCPGDSVLDRKEGPQKMDVDVKDLKCAIDDEKDCKPPTVPETRPNGLENNASFKPKCLDLKEDDKTTCDADQQYTEVLIGPDGKAKRSCRPTRQYEAKKRNRWQNMKDKFRQRWNERKEERAKKDEEREARRQAIQDGNQKKEKEAGDKKKKKEKSYKCGMVTALLDGRNIKDLLPIRRDLAPREDNSNIDSYMDMTTCWFDEGFVNDDAFLDFFPQDVNVDDIGIEIVSGNLRDDIKY